MTVTGISPCGLLPGWCARHRFLAAAEDFDDAHRATAAWARFTWGERCGLPRVLGFPFGRTLPEQVVDAVDGGLACCAGQRSVVPDAMQAVREHLELVAHISERDSPRES